MMGLELQEGLGGGGRWPTGECTKRVKSRKEESAKKLFRPSYRSVPVKGEGKRELGRESLRGQDSSQKALTRLMGTP